VERDAWGMRGRKLQKSCKEDEEFIYIVEDLQHKLENDEFELMAVVARNL
jgi:hypothetical protein